MIHFNGLRRISLRNTVATIMVDDSFNIQVAFPIVIEIPGEIAMC